MLEGLGGALRWELPSDPLLKLAKTLRVTDRPRLTHVAQTEGLKATQQRNQAIPAPSPLLGTSISRPRAPQHYHDVLQR